MAFTVSHLAKSVFGDMRVVSIRVTADATTGAVATGLQHILGIGFTPQSMSTAIAHKVAINETCSGAASNGNLGVTGVTSGDEMIYVVFGK